MGQFRGTVYTVLQSHLLATREVPTAMGTMGIRGPCLGSFPSSSFFPTPFLGLLGSPPECTSCFECLVFLAPGGVSLRFWGSRGLAWGRELRDWEACLTPHPLSEWGPGVLLTPYPLSFLPSLPVGELSSRRSAAHTHRWPSGTPFNSPGAGTLTGGPVHLSGGWHTYQVVDTLARELTHSWGGSALLEGLTHLLGS